MLKDFSNEIGSNINEYEFLILYNEMHQHLEDLQNSVNQYCTKKKKSVVYNVINIFMIYIQSVRSMDFNVIVYDRFIGMVSESIF